MKRVFGLTALFGLVAFVGLARESVSPPRVVERGPHHAVTETVITYANVNGGVFYKTNRYTELQTGMNRMDASGAWVPANERIEIINNLAIARGGQHQVVFQGDIQTESPTIKMADGAEIRTKILGLSYWDSSTGKSVLIAEIKSAQGEVLASGNEIIYRDCFDGDDVSGAVLYTYTKAGLVQDIVLYQQLPSPAEWGLNPATTHLECLTEVLEGPQPIVERRGDGNLDDSTLNFGTMQMVPGKAFPVGLESDAVPVNKHWMQAEGRSFVVEQIGYEAIKPHLKKLPKANGGLAPVRHQASPNRILPKLREAKRSVPQGFKVAGASEPKTGFVLDYTLLNTATNFTFQGDTTYSVTGPVFLSGTTVIEGGTVVKFAANHSSITFYGPVTCVATNYRPAAFTAKDDDSVGETISGSTGNPTGYYAGTALSFINGTNLVNLQNIRVGYALNAVAINGGFGHKLSHMQIYNCVTGVNATNATFKLRNALAYNVMTNFSGYMSTGAVTHLTVDNASVFNTGISLSVTNSLLVSVGYLGTFSSNTVFITNAAGVFRTVGAGQHYLATNSLYRNCGVTNIDPDLLVALRSKTTYPPVVYSNSVVSSALVLGPAVSRDTNANLDIGYHYEPLDYAFGGVTANSNITFTAGTAVGWFRTSSGWNMKVGHGINMADYQTVSFAGNVMSPVYWVRCNTVQEGANRVWCGGYGPGGVTGSAGTLAAAPTVKARFARCSMMEWVANNHFRDDSGYIIEDLRNTEFYAGSLGGYWHSINATNCLFDRTIFGVSEGLPDTYFTFANCTARGAYVSIDRSYAVPVSIRNCSFDGVTMNTADSFSTDPCTDYDYNAFSLGYETTPTGVHDVIVTNFNWQTGTLGAWYLPTNSTLINAGSRTADSTGLYHFTTQVGQTKEAKTIVDSGYHYVALDVNGNPVDTDGDGIPDYAADANGNGIVDNGEAPWAIIPAITVQPASVTANQGSNAIFNVTATGSTPLYYQWFFNSVSLPGATSSSYTVFNVQATNAGTYSVVISNVVGGVTSSNAVLTVILPPSITAQPTNVTLNPGSNATFTVAAAGTAPLSYQWYFNGTSIPGATTNAYTIYNVQSTNAGSYSVSIWNAAGSVSSTNAILTVNSKPSITQQPATQSVVQGSNVTFSVSVAGTTPLYYQWYFNNSNAIFGATSGSYTLTNAQPTNAGNYSVVVTNYLGSVTSSNAALTVNIPPLITMQPTNATVIHGTNVSFSVTATGTSPLYYQWRYNTTNISGATSNVYTLYNVQTTNSGSYSVVVTNVAGSVTSTNAVLTVN